MGKNKLSIVISKHFLIILFLAFYFTVISIKVILHPTPFYDWDESINVQVAREMVEKNSLVPIWQGKAWLDKPPLPFLFFGIIMKLTPFIKPEISLRIISLILSLSSLIFVYAVYLKVETPQWGVPTTIIPFLTVIITAFTPIFLQRSQILNLDVFLLIGWLGYLLFVQNFWLSLLFLGISVLTKSLIGFYPVVLMLIFNLFQILKPPRLRKPTLHRLGEPRRLIRMAITQIGILSLWYVFMLIIFGQDFWQQHIIETHFRRVTASIESHFGQKTYYIDLIRDQIGIFFWFSLLGLINVILSAAKNLSIYLRKSRIRERSFTYVQDDKLLYSLFLFPWFIFLNLTKTKIFWYLYPAIPQFAFLSVYPLHVILNKAKRSEESSASVKRSLRSLDPSLTLRMTAGLLIIAVIFYQNFIKTNFFTTFYSKPEDHYRLALYVKDKCDSLTVLVGKETRDAIKTLENLGLTITSTKQWGDHPSVVYYFGKKVYFEYDKNLLIQKLISLSQENCLAIQKDDLDLNLATQGYKRTKSFDTFYLFKR